MRPHRQSASPVAAGPAPIHILTLFLSAGGLAIIVASCRDSSVGMKTAVMVTLLILLSGYNVIARLDSQLSARNCAAQLLPSLAQNMYSFKLQRGWKYQLNFYLHREIMEWSPEVPGPALVVTNEKNLPALKQIARIDSVVWDGSSQAEIVAVTPLTR